MTVVLFPCIPAGNPLHPGRPASYEGSAEPCGWLPPCSQSQLRRGLDPTWPSPAPGSTPDIPGQPARHSMVPLSLLGGRSHLSPPVPPAFPGSERRSAKYPSRLPTCVQRLRVLCELAGLGSCGSLSPWRDETVVQLAAGGGCLWRTCGVKDEAWDGGGCAGTKAPAVLPSPALASRQLLATTARLSSVPSCSLPLGHRCGAARASAIPAPALPQRNPRSRAWPATFPPSPPPPPHCQALPPASPSPHLAALVQAWQPLMGLGAGIRLLLLGHLRGPLPDTCHGHPGETLAPDGAALLGVGTLGLWPYKRPHGRCVDPVSQWPLGKMPPLVTKAWRSPRRWPARLLAAPWGQGLTGPQTC